MQTEVQNFFLRQAHWKYYDEYPEQLEEVGSAREMERDEVVAVLDSKFGGEIKIHHTNNAKLVEVEANIFARRVKLAISCLRDHLEAKQAKRKQGLGALIRQRYS